MSESSNVLEDVISGPDLRNIVIPLGCGAQTTIVPWRIGYSAKSGEIRESPDVTRKFKTRCTRRYSPGVCADHVSPVWTFVFQEQNCTERLGCASYFRSNRFKSYGNCMRQCKGLIDIYLQMMEAIEGNNASLPLRKGYKPKSVFMSVQSRKQGSDYAPPPELDYLDDQMEDEEVEHESRSIVYQDLSNYEIFPPDVDRQDGQIRSWYDLLHPRR